MITNTVSKVTYTGDGTTKQFQVTFPFIAITDLQLFLCTIATGEYEEIDSNWSYDDGYITYPVNGSAITSAKQIVIQRNTPITQEKDHDVRLFTSEDVEGMADKLTRIAQELKRDSEVNAQKQDPIPDLDEIRSNASAGAGAATTISGYGDIVTHDANEFATASQGDKADSAIQPSDLNITALNDVSISSPSSAQVLAYDATTQKWKNSSSSASVAWGGVTGTLSNQTDLQNALDAKQATVSDLETIRSGAALGATAVQPGDLATVATSGAYSDLSGTPTIPTVDQTYSALSTNAQSGVAVASAINGKADTDLANVTNTGKSTAAGWAMPSSTSISVTMGADGASYTAPANGYFNVRGRASAVYQYVYIGDALYTNVAFQRFAIGADDWIVFTIPILKGQSCIVNYNVPEIYLYFIYAEGSKTEAN